MPEHYAREVGYAAEQAALEDGPCVGFREAYELGMRWHDYLSLLNDPEERERKIAQYIKTHDELNR